MTEHPEQSDCLIDAYPEITLLIQSIIPKQCQLTHHDQFSSKSGWTSLTNRSNETHTEAPLDKMHPSDSCWYRATIRPYGTGRFYNTLLTEDVIARADDRLLGIDAG